MFLLNLLLARQEDVAALVTVLARIQKRSFSSLASECCLHKSALLRFCKQQQGGYLSADGRQRVLSALGWGQTGLSAARVHVWQISDVADARFLFQRALGGCALLSDVEQYDAEGPRLFVGACAGAPLIVSATYTEEPAVDPLIADVSLFVPKQAGPLQLSDLGDIAKVQKSPRAFFAHFGAPPATKDLKVEPPPVQRSPLASLYDLGFEDDLIRALVDDFITLQCKIDPVSMRARVAKNLYSGPIVPDRFQEALLPGVEAATKRAVDELGRRPFALNWRSPAAESARSVGGRDPSNPQT